MEFLGRTLHVVRQVKLVRGRFIFALPKGRKTRDIPLPETVATELASHIAAFPPLNVTLLWETPSGEPTTAQLLLYSRERHALNRRHFNAYVWKAALAAAGVEPSRQRHACPAALLRLGAAGCGESVKALSEYLGHSDPGFTLRTYTHLLPTSEQRTRQAVGRRLRARKCAADGLHTAQEQD